MNRLLMWLTAMGGLLASAVIDWVIRGSVILLLAWVVSLALRRDSAATRHFVWTTAICLLILLPALSVTLPAWRVLPAWTRADESQPVVSGPATLPTIAQHASVTVVPTEPLRLPFLPPGNRAPMEFPVETTESAVSTVPFSGQTSVTAPNSAQPTGARRTGTPAWRPALALCWLAGCAGWCLRLGLSIRRLHISARNSIDVHTDAQPSLRDPGHNDRQTGLSTADRARLLTALNSARTGLLVTRPVQLLLDSHRSIPIVWGFRTIRLQLPRDAVHWTDEQLRSVLLHELAHVRRSDLSVLLLTQLACALHWFNPLIWLAAWRLHHERERACDDLVLASGVRASTYAEHLLQVATRLTTPRRTHACGLAMARTPAIESRLRAVLSGRQNRRAVTWTLAVVLAAFGLAVSVPVAILRASSGDWNPPHAVHIRRPEFSTYCIHRDGTAMWVVASETDFKSSSSNTNNPATRAWQNAGTLTIPAKTGDKDITFQQSATWPDQLTLGGTRYDLASGRVFLASRDDGQIRQLPLQSAVIDDFSDHAQLQRQILEADPDSALPRFIAVTTYGTTSLSDGVRLEISGRAFHAADVATTAVLRWPATGEVPSLEHRIPVAADMFGNDEPWTLVCDTRARMLWIATGKHSMIRQPPHRLQSLKSINYSDPAALQATTWYDFRAEVPAEVRTLVTRDFTWFDPQQQQSVISTMETTEAMMTSPVWLVTGILRDAQGQARHDARYGVFRDGKQIWFGGTNSEGRYHHALQLPVSALTQGCSVAVNEPVEFPAELPDLSSLPSAPEAPTSEDTATPTTRTEIQPQHRRISAAEVRDRVFRVPQPGLAMLTGVMRAPDRSDLQPVENGIVAAFDTTAEFVVTGVTSRADNQGRFRLDGIPTGHPVTVYASSGEPAAARTSDGLMDGGTFSADEVRNADITFEYHDRAGWFPSIEFRMVSAPVISGINIDGLNNVPSSRSQPTNLSNMQTPGGLPVSADLAPHLVWGDPVNGLRAAVLVRLQTPPTSDEYQPSVLMVLQNVSGSDIHFCEPKAVISAGAEQTPNQKTMYLREDGEILFAMRNSECSDTDVVLPPDGMIAIDFFGPPQAAENADTGAVVTEGLLLNPGQTFGIVLQLEQVPPGAWAGQLTAPPSRGAVSVEGPFPSSQKGQALFRYFVDHARLNGRIPGGLMARLHDKVEEFIRLNSGDQYGDPYARKMEPLLARFAAQGDWSQADVVAVFDAIADVTEVPLETTLEQVRDRTLQRGQQLPARLRSANWGQEFPGGLRLAWILEPQADAIALGTSLKSRVVLWNSGKEPVAFVTRSFHQPDHTATDADGRGIETESTQWLTRGRPEPYRLHPGEFCEVHAPGIGLGRRSNRQDDWANVHPGTWIHAREGDEVSFQAGPILLTGDHNGQVDPDWWLEFIRERLDREAPLPDDAAARRLILFRAVKELFGTAPYTEEADAFYADRSPAALDHLAETLSSRSWLTSVAGPITSAPTTFRVLAEDPAAATRPRIATGPGRYNLQDELVLIVTRRPAGSRLVNEASLTWYPAGRDAVPNAIPLPDGEDSWAAGWSPGTRALWIRETDHLRQYDFSRPQEISETAYATPEAAATEMSDDLAAALSAALPPVTAPAPASARPATPAAPATESRDGDN